MSSPHNQDKGPYPQVNQGYSPGNPGYPPANPGYPPAQPGVVYQQPSTTTVVVQQPTVVGKPMRDWSTGTFDCFEDCGICLCGTFCGLCLACQVSDDMQESMILPCCVLNFITVMRTKMRTQENIQGSILNDCCMDYWCGPCSLCQLAREVKYVRNQRSGVM